MPRARAERLTFQLFDASEAAMHSLSASSSVDISALKAAVAFGFMHFDRCEAVISSSALITAALSMRWPSYLTLPGQLWRESNSSAPGPNRKLLPRPEEALLRKCPASAGMSSALARSGGRCTLQTFSL